MRRILALGLMCAVRVVSAAESNELSLFVDIGKTRLWRTSAQASPLIEWDTPSVAVSATLTVASLRGEAEIDVTGRSSYQLTFDAPTSADSENVYDLVLTFDCGASNIVRRGQIGCVRGIAATGAAGAVADMRPQEGWDRLAARCAVLPVPAGAGALEIDGTAVDTGLGGAAGWYGWKGVLPKLERAPYVLSLESDSGTWQASVIAVARGLSLIVR